MGSDTDTRFFWTSDTDSDMDSDKVMTSDTDTSSDKGMSENHGLGHGQTSDTRVRSSLANITSSKSFWIRFSIVGVGLGSGLFSEIGEHGHSCPRTCLSTYVRGHGRGHRYHKIFESRTRTSNMIVGLGQRWRSIILRPSTFILRVRRTVHFQSNDLYFDQWPPTLAQKIVHNHPGSNDRPVWLKNVTFGWTVNFKERPRLGYPI